MEEENKSRSQSLNYNYSDADFDEDPDNGDTKSMVSAVPLSPTNTDISEVELLKPVAKKPKVEKKEIVKRTLPLVADAIIFLLELTIAVGFLYFAYIYPNRDRDCVADDYVDVPLQ